MQRQGGGSCPCSGGLLKGGSNHRGGGNDPTCGCDMQAGWPSNLPRGGIQGGGSKVTTDQRGGNWNFNEFNLALTKNGKTRHLRGKWNKNKTSRKKSYITSKKTRRVTSAPSRLSRRRSQSTLMPRTPTSLPRRPNYRPQTPPYESQTPPYGTAFTPRNNNTNLLEGGRHKGKKHGKGCTCFLCMFKKMKV